MTRLHKLLCAFSIALAVHAPVYSQSFMEHSQALDQLAALFPTGEKPSIAAFKANPLVQESLDTVTNSQKYLDGMPHSTQDQALMCLRVNNTLTQFIFFGIPNADQLIKAPQRLDAATRAALENNMIQFLPELDRLEVFGFKCSAKLTQHLIQAYDPTNTTPGYKNNFEKRKFDTFKTFFSILMKSSMEFPPNHYRTALSKAVADTSPTFASIFSKKQRALIISSVQKVMPGIKDAQVTTHIQQVLQTLETAPCTPLCDLGD